MKQMDGKISLITGSGRGIGRAVAELFAAEGATVVLTARTGDEIEKTAASIESAGGKAVAVAGDITDETSVERLFRDIAVRFGRLDVLVNNAGCAAGGLVEEFPVEKLRAMLELNIVAVFNCMQQAIRMMKANGGVGKIINIGSVRSHWTECGDAGAYNASKCGLRAMTESVARQLHGSGLNIAVGMVNPGIADTTLTNPQGNEVPDWLRPETIARAVLHAATAPPNVNIFDTVLIGMMQKPW
jgi:NAD(P)-dependent dehydrogenase (short-subunit alcohol dehydrogenase family)